MPDLISEKYRNASLTVLVREEEKAARLVERYPQVIPKIGDLTSLDLLESCSKDAEVVISKLIHLLVQWSSTEDG